MRKANLLLLSLCVTTAAALAGCFHGEEPTPPPPTNNNTNNTNNTQPPPAAAFTGGDNITGAGPNTMKSITITVGAGHKQIDVSFREKGATGPLPAVPAQQFNAVLKDPAGNETATATATSATIGASVGAGQSGAWTLDVSFAATPATTVEVIYTVS